MRIGLISQAYPPETAGGGIGTQTYLKAHGLAALNHEVYVISHSIDGGRYQYKDGLVHIIRIPGFDSRMPVNTDIVRWLTYSAEVAAAIYELHKRTPLDILDFPDWGSEGYIYLLNRTEWDYIPAVIHLHGPIVMFAHTMGWPDMDSEFYRVGTHMEATCVQLANVVYSSSECSAKWVRAHYTPQKVNIPTIHLGVDTNVFAPQPVPKNDRTTILFIGKIVQNKGVEELVDAASYLVREFPDLRLRMIGKGEDVLINQLQEKAGKLGAHNLLDFPGFIKKDALPEELSRAHVFASPSYYEGGPGFVFLEAMSCGLPVVGCSGSGVEEIVLSGENGILVPPKDTKALEQALRKILNDTESLENMGSNARNYVLREADSQLCLNRLENFYHSVIKEQVHLEQF